MNSVPSRKIAAIRADETSVPETPDTDTNHALGDYGALPKATDRLYVTLTGQCNQLNAFNRELLDEAKELRDQIATQSATITTLTSANASLRTSKGWSQFFDVLGTTLTALGGLVISAFEKSDMRFTFGAGLVFSGAALGVFKYVFARHEKHE